MKTNKRHQSSHFQREIENSEARNKIKQIFPGLDEIKNGIDKFRISDTFFYHKKVRAKNMENGMHKNYYRTSHNFGIKGSLRPSVKKELIKIKTRRSSKNGIDKEASMKRKDLFVQILGNGKASETLNPDKQAKNEIMAYLKQSKYKQRPNSSRVQKRCFLSAKGPRNNTRMTTNPLQDDISDVEPQSIDLLSSKKGRRIHTLGGRRHNKIKRKNPNELNKGIFPKKAQKDAFPIKTMFEASDGTPKYPNIFQEPSEFESAFSFKENDIDPSLAKRSFAKKDNSNQEEISIIGRSCGYRREIDSAIPGKRSRNGVIRKNEFEGIEVSNQEDTLLRPESSNTIVSFQTSLSPEFLNLFAR